MTIVTEIRSIEKRIEANEQQRERLSELRRRKIAQLYHLYGATKTAEVLGITRQRVYQMVSGEPRYRNREVLK